MTFTNTHNYAVTIFGNGHTITRGSGATDHLITHSRNSELKVNNLNFSDGDVAASGSLLRSTGSGALSINNSVFDGSTTSNTGNLVSKEVSANSSVTFTNTTFNGNAVTGDLISLSSDNNSRTMNVSFDNCTVNGAASGSGSLVSKTTDGTFSATNGTAFYGNGSSGTLISLSHSNDAVTISNTTISAGTSTGTLISDTGTGAVTFTNTNLTRNQSVGCGFYKAAGGNVTFEDCTIDGSGTPTATQPLILMGTGELTLNNTTVTGHTISTSGVCAVDALSASKVKLYGSTEIYGNTANGNPANIKIPDDASKTSITSSLNGSIGITTTKYSLNSDFANLADAEFTGWDRLTNDVLEAAGTYYYVFHVTGTQNYLRWVNYKYYVEQTTGDNGASFETLKDAVASINDRRHDCNLYIGENCTLNEALTFTNTHNYAVTIFGNGHTITRGSGATDHLITHSRNSELKVNNLNFSDGDVAASGSLLRSTGSGALSINNSVFDGSTTSNTGNLVSKEVSANSSVTFANTTINGHAVTGHLLSISSTNNYQIGVTLSGCTFNGSTVGDGHLVYKVSSTGTLEFNNGTSFNGNGSTGSMIYNGTAGEMKFDQAILNRGASTGIGVESASTGKVTFTNSTLNGNETEATGSLVKIGSSELTLDNTTVINHTASSDDVCAIDASSASKVSLSGSTKISGNTANNKPANLKIPNDKDKTYITSSLTENIGITTDNYSIGNDFAKWNDASSSGWSEITNDKLDYQNVVYEVFRISGYLQWNNYKYYVERTNGTNGASFETLKEAVASINERTYACNLYIGEDCTLDEALTFTYTHNYAVTIFGDGHTITRGSGATGDLIIYDRGTTRTLTIYDLTLDGNNVSATGSLLKLGRSVQLCLKNFTAQNHTASVAGVCAVDASAAGAANYVQIYTAQISGNTAAGVPANLKIKGTNYLYFYGSPVLDIGITNDEKYQEGEQFSYLNTTSYVLFTHVKNDKDNTLAAKGNGHIITWTSSDEDPLDVMFGNPEVHINDLVTYPSEDVLSELPADALQGCDNTVPTNPYMVWKSITYDDSDNSVDINLNYFQKQVNLKLDFIFVIDETGTMGDNKTANGYTMTQALWARYAAVEASKGVLKLNEDYAAYNTKIRIRFISFGGANKHDSGFKDNYDDAVASIDYPVIGGGTYHSIGINAATAAANESRAEGRQPVIVYLSDYQLYFRVSPTGGPSVHYIATSEMNAIKNVSESIYAFLVYETHNTTIATRMSLLSPLHYFMEDADDPSTLITPFIAIIHDAVAHCGRQTVIKDNLANGLIPAADQNTVTSNDVGGQTNAVINENGMEIWQLLNDAVYDRRLYTATMYNKVINIPMTDDAYSGYMETNSGLYVEDAGNVVDRIDASPKLKKSLVLILKDNNSSAPLAGATFTLTHGTNTWNLVTDSEGKMTLPWAENDFVGATTAESTFAFNVNDEYVLRETQSVAGYVKPAGYWTLKVSDTYKISSETTEGSRSDFNHTLDIVPHQGKLEIYNETAKIARVSNDGGSTWTYHDYLINSSGTGTALGAFDKANTLSGDVIIETLLETHERYTLGQGFTFNGASLTSVTLRTTQDDGYNPLVSGQRFVSTITRGYGGASLITSSVALTLENIIFDGASGTYTCNTNGGIVNATGAVTYRNTTSGEIGIRNSESSKKGGAIYAGGNVTVTGNTNGYIFFENCVTTRSNSGNDREAGGAICQHGGTGTSISYARFGALIAESVGKTRDELAMADIDPAKACTANNGEVYGGAVYVCPPSTNAPFSFSASNAEFYGCTAFSGGGIYIDHSDESSQLLQNPDHNDNMVESFTDCTFIGCSTHGTENTNYGGGICDEHEPGHSKLVTMTGCMFTDCTAYYWSGGAILRGLTTTVSDCTFTRCQGANGGNGGALFIQEKKNDGNSDMGDDDTITIEDCEFSDCHVEGYGGAVSVGTDKDSKGSKTTISGCTFDNCSANSSELGGGAVFARTKELNISGSTFTNCQAKKGHGGAVYQMDGVTLNVSNTTFGGLNAGEDSSDPSALTVNSVNYGKYCYAGGTGTNGLLGDGGAIYTTASSSLSVSNSRFYGVTANNMGGGVYIEHVKSTTLTESYTNCDFIGCRAVNMYAGAICDDNDPFYSSEVTVSGCTFTDCTAKQWSGAAIFRGLTTTVENSSFTRCKGTDSGNGGALFLFTHRDTGKTDITDITHCVFTDCEVKGNGGAIYLGDDANTSKPNNRATISDCTFNGCKSTSTNGNGGAVWAYSEDLTISNSTITGCEVNGNGTGGAIYQYGGTLTVKDLVKIDDNHVGTALSNIHMGGSDKKIYIGTEGLECGSHIGVSNNSTDGAVVATGSTTNCSHAYHNGFFFDDANLYTPYQLSYASYTDNNLYFINSWENYANESGITIADNVITVSNGAGLAYFAKQVNEGNDYSGKTVILGNDIDLSGHYWVPIGLAAEGTCDTDDKSFSGTFNGQGHVISNMTSILPYCRLGLFGKVKDGTITNTFVKDGTLNYTCVLSEGEASYMGGLAGSVEGSAVITYSEAETTIMGGSGSVMGGLVGKMGGNSRVHSSLASSTITGGTGSVTGGLVGKTESGSTLANSYSNITITGSDNAGGLVGTNTGTVANCYTTATANALAYTNTGTINYCYAPSVTPTANCGTYSPVLDRKAKGYMYGDNAVTLAGDASSTYHVTGITYDNTTHQMTGWPGMLSALNNWVEANPLGITDLAPWYRPTTGAINGDLPVLGLPGFNSMATMNGGSFLEYSNDLDALLTNFNGKTDTEHQASLFLYGNATDVADVPSANVKVFVNEDACLLQSGTGEFKATVGVTFDNSCRNALDESGQRLNYDWHLMSTPLKDAPIGITYKDYEPHGYGSGIDISAMSGSYFPDELPMTLHHTDWKWDFYSYYEPSYHWINMKRNKNNHYHMDTNDTIIYNQSDQATTDAGSAACRFTPGKGYLMAIQQESYMSSTGTLNNGEVGIKLSANAPEHAVSEAHKRGTNLIGNPYQSYLDLDKVNEVNGTEYSFYIYDADRGMYVPYYEESSPNTWIPSRYIHPHQGFFVIAPEGDADFKFTADMATTAKEDGSYLREGRPSYPLVNLLAEDAAGHRDLTIIEFNRPEQGGALKTDAMRTANFRIAAHYGSNSYGILFTPEGTERVPVHFHTYADGVFTLRWDMQNGDFTSLHLIDNVTGVNYDMLANDSYTFESTTEDYPSRFYITYACTDIDEQLGESGNSFCFYDGSEWVVNGKGQLDVIDVTGRVLRSERLSNDQNRVNLNGYAKGMYMMRLVDGKQVRVQKIVVY